MISLSGVHLRYPLAGFVSHSFQRALYGRVGGLFGFKGKGTVIDHVHALRGVDLEVRDGERLGIIGHNGAGKTSLLRVITGVYPPTSGDVVVSGKVNALTDVTLGMDPNASGYKNIIFRLVFMGYSFREAREALDEIIEFTELGDFIHLPVQTYSTGMFLRLAFAISTHFVPDILVLDEVVSAGDLGFQQKAMARIKSLFDRSRIMVLAAHDLNSIAEFCTRAVVLSRGVIAAQGSPEEMIEAYRNGEIAVAEAAVGTAS